MKQINIFIEMVICMAVDSKREVDFGKKGRKSETQMAQKNKTQKCPVDTTCQNV